jgi:hypothetical protein
VGSEDGLEGDREGDIFQVGSTMPHADINSLDS